MAPDRRTTGQRYQRESQIGERVMAISRTNGVGVTSRVGDEELLGRQGTPGPPPHPDMVWIPGGTFRMGSDDHYPEETPVHRVTVEGFWMDRFPVTNQRFHRFVDATGYVTTAEIPPDPTEYPGALPHTLFAGSLVFVKPAAPVDLWDFPNWWTFVRGANWRHPSGPHSSIEGRKRHPTVHVTFRDAEAF